MGSQRGLPPRELFGGERTRTFFEPLELAIPRLLSPRTHGKLSLDPPARGHALSACDALKSKTACIAKPT